jgi:hypothetical protein
MAESSVESQERKESAPFCLGGNQVDKKQNKRKLPLEARISNQRPFL